LPGLADKVGAVFALAFAHRARDLSFNNPALAQQFAAGQIDALCKACRKRFNQRTGAAAELPPRAAGPARPVVERLRELEQLRAENLLTDDEYQRKRAEILKAL
jgi:hypothetical protein